MKVLCVVHFREELDKFKYILPRLGDTTAIYDTDINLKNAKNWVYRGWLTLYSVGASPRPWWYLLARYSDDYRFWKRVKNSSYYENRAYRTYPRWVKPLVRFPFGFLKSFYRAPEHIRKHLSELKPDIILTTSLCFPPLHVQAEYILEGKRMGIPTVSLIPNHDALTTKSAMYPIPDYVFCWNDDQKEELKLHGVKEEQIRKVGAWSFEEWVRPWKPTRRDKFCRKWGLRADLSIYTYLTSSNSITGWEVESVERWRDWQKGLGDRGQLVVRPHPDKAHLMNQIEGVRCIPELPQGVFEPEAFQLALDTYYHSSALYCVNTSAAIEAMLVGRPVYKIQSDNPDTQKNCLHFRQMKPFLNENGPKNIRKWLFADEKLPSDLIVDNIFSIIKR